MSSAVLTSPPKATARLVVDTVSIIRGPELVVSTGHWRKCATTRRVAVQRVVGKGFVACSLAICLQPDRHHFRKVNENEIRGIALNIGAKGGEIGPKSFISK